MGNPSIWAAVIQSLLANRPSTTLPGNLTPGFNPNGTNPADLIGMAGGMPPSAPMQGIPQSVPPQGLPQLPSGTMSTPPTFPPPSGSSGGFLNKLLTGLSNPQLLSSMGGAVAAGLGGGKRALGSFADTMMQQQQFQQQMKQRQAETQADAASRERQAKIQEAHYEELRRQREEEVAASSKSQQDIAYNQAKSAVDQFIGNFPKDAKTSDVRDAISEMLSQYGIAPERKTALLRSAVSTWNAQAASTSAAKRYVYLGENEKAKPIINPAQYAKLTSEQQEQYEENSTEEGARARAGQIATNRRMENRPDPQMLEDIKAFALVNFKKPYDQMTVQEQAHARTGYTAWKASLWPGQTMVLPNQMGEPGVRYNKQTGRYEAISLPAGTLLGPPNQLYQQAIQYEKAGPLIDALSDLSEKINTGQGIVAKARGEVEKAKARLNYNDDVAEYQALVSGATPLMSRAMGHVGVLTQLDVDSVKAMFPAPGESKTLRDRKVNRLHSILSGVKAATQTPVPDVTGPEVPPEPMVKMKTPNGNMKMVPKTKVPDAQKVGWAVVP